MVAINRKSEYPVMMMLCYIKLEKCIKKEAILIFMN